MDGQGELDLGVTVARVAGVDEAGRGPLAGPVIAAAVILDPARPVAGLADSKRLAPGRREILDRLIRASALACATGVATAAEIDRLNILQASLLAMRRAVSALAVTPDAVWVDGNRPPRLAIPVRAVVGGDATVPEIGAASILAKVLRDHEMVALAARYPGYGFERHKGYPTREHVAAIARLGVTPAHRRSFGPVRAALARAGAELTPGG
ncbi:MAG TPA: ribonuclease HII [Gammaproteobacteria bacterium]|nr:ribonuclease HII [Gammaproteobacteria bacterium]